MYHILTKNKTKILQGFGGEVSEFRQGSEIGDESTMHNSDCILKFH